MSNIQNQANSRRRIMLVCLVIAVLSICSVVAQEATRGQQAQQPPGTALTALIPIKYCEGKYRRSSDGSEVIVSVTCTSPDVVCECNKTEGVSCGGTVRKRPNPGYTLVEDSCKTTNAPDR
jgi:hypothetical protein